MSAEARAAETVRALIASGRTIATAESLTAGMLAARIADVPGASAALRGGLIVYATDLKASLAGVDAELLAARGAVDPDVAAGLAAGAAERCGADIGIGCTGVAGPDPQDGQPVGRVFIGVSADGEVRVSAFDFSGSRPEIREQTVDAALVLVAEAIGA